MSNFLNFHKNAGAALALFCCLFFNPGEGNAQVTIITEMHDTVVVTMNDLYNPQNQSAFCSEKEILFDIPVSDPNPTVLVLQTTPSKRFIFAAYVDNIGFIDANIEFRPLSGSNRRVGKSGPFSISGGDTTAGVYSGSASAWSWNNNGGAIQTLKTWIGLNSTGLGYIYYYRGFNPVIDVSTGVTLYDFDILIPIIITGPLALEVPILGTTVQPQIPYMVLHAPPGDGSSSEFQETKTTCREFVDTYAEDGSNSANLDVKLGVAGSIGFIATVDFEFSVTFSAGFTAGDLAVTTKSNQTCVTASEGFSTNALLGNNGGGDVFIGYGTDLNYGLFPRISVDPNSCIARRDTGLVYVPTGNPRKFVYTEEAIQADILSQKVMADNPALTVRQRNEAQNQADIWEKVLAQNNANKNNPNNAVIENISFSAGANSSQESSITVLETNSLEVEHYTEFNTGISTVLEIGGSGISGGYEYRGSYRYGKTNNSSAETAKVVRYTLADDDGGDKFDVKVVRDPMYGTPVFRVESTSKSSCPYQGGYQRDQPKLKHDGTTNDHITLLGNPVGSSATFKLDLCNESNEVRTYNLKLNAQSNLNGAVVSAAGVPLNGNDLGQSFNVPANSCVQDLIVEVKQLSANSPLSYPDLELFLYAPCEEDIQTSVFASVYFGNATGVNDLADNSLLSVSPNPTSGWLQISLPAGNSLETVRVMDLSGKTVRNLERGASASNTEIDLSGLPKGIYVLQARSEGQVFVKKVIVE